MILQGLLLAVIDWSKTALYEERKKRVLFRNHFFK